MLHRHQLVRLARSFLSKALPFFVVNAVIPPTLLMMLSRVGSALVYVVLWPIVVYFAFCLFSILLLFAGRSALTEYSLDSAQKLLLVAGTLGLFTGLILGGLFTLRARNYVLRSVEAERIKKQGRAGTP